MIKSALVLGNGPGRLDLDLNRVRAQGDYFIYGCNAIYRDFSVDALVANDVRMIVEIAKSGYIKNNLCYFPGWQPMEARKFMFNFLAPYDIVQVNQDERGDANKVVVYGDDDKTVYLISVPDNCRAREFPNHYHLFTGPLAVHKAAQDGYEDVFLYGFDVRPDEDFNVYRGTENYPDSPNPHINQTVEQLRYIFKKHPETKFYVNRGHPMPDEWRQDNVTEFGKYGVKATFF